MAVVGMTEEGREILGHESCVGINPRWRFKTFDDKTDPDGSIRRMQDQIWLGGDVRMPYWADGNQSPFLTKDELNKYLAPVRS